MTEFTLLLAVVALGIAVMAYQLARHVDRAEDASYRVFKARLDSGESFRETTIQNLIRVGKVIDELEARLRHRVQVTDQQGRCICPTCQRAHRESIRKAQAEARRAARERREGE